MLSILKRQMADGTRTVRITFRTHYLKLSQRRQYCIAQQKKIIGDAIFGARQTHNIKFQSFWISYQTWPLEKPIKTLRFFPVFRNRKKIFFPKCIIIPVPKTYSLFCIECMAKNHIAKHEHGLNIDHDA